MYEYGKVREHEREPERESEHEPEHGHGHRIRSILEPCTILYRLSGNTVGNDKITSKVCLCWILHDICEVVYNICKVVLSQDLY